MMSKIIYRYEQFVIKKTENGELVVVNNNGEYEHHSHVKHFEAGRAICKLAAKRKIINSNKISSSSVKLKIS